MSGCRTTEWTRIRWTSPAARSWRRRSVRGRSAPSTTPGLRCGERWDGVPDRASAERVERGGVASAASGRAVTRTSCHASLIERRDARMPCRPGDAGAQGLAWFDVVRADKGHALDRMPFAALDARGTLSGSIDASLRLTAERHRRRPRDPGTMVAQPSALACPRIAARRGADARKRWRPSRRSPTRRSRSATRRWHAERGGRLGRPRPASVATRCGRLRSAGPTTNGSPRTDRGGRVARCEPQPA